MPKMPVEHPFLNHIKEQFFKNINIKQLNFKSYIDNSTERWVKKNNDHLIVKIYSKAPIEQQPDYKYYVIFINKREGEGAYGNIYKALEINQTTGEVITEPLVAKFQTMLSTKAEQEFEDRIVNEAEIQSQYRFTERPFYIKSSKSTQACLISAYIPGAGVVDDNLVEHLTLLQRVDAICQYTLQLHSMHHKTACTKFQTLHRDIHVGNLSFYQFNNTVHGEIYDFNLSIKLVDYSPERTFKVAKREGVLPLLAPEYLTKMEGSLNSDIYAFTSLILHFLGVSFYRKALKDKKSIMREYIDDKPELYKKMVVSKFNTNDIFKNIVFPKNILGGEALLKNTIKQLILRMQEADPIRRVNSDELLTFFINLRQLLLENSQSRDLELQSSYLAKMLLIVNNLWKTPIDDISYKDFSSYDFHAPSETNFQFCRAIIELSNQNILTAPLLQLITPRISISDLGKKGCDLFLMSAPKTKTGYMKSDKTHLYLYKDDDDNFFYFDFIDVSKSPGKLYFKPYFLDKNIKDVLQTAEFNQPKNNPVKCEEKEICNAILKVTSERGQTRKYVTDEEHSKIVAENLSKMRREEMIIEITIKLSKVKTINEPYMDFDKLIKSLKKMSTKSLEYLSQSPHYNANILWLMDDANVEQYLRLLKAKHKPILLSIQLFLVQNQTELKAQFPTQYQTIYIKVAGAALGNLKEYHQFKTHLEKTFGPDHHTNYLSKLFGLKHCSTSAKRKASEQVLAAFTRKGGVKTFFNAYNGEDSKLLRDSLNNSTLKRETHELISYLKTLGS